MPRVLSNLMISLQRKLGAGTASPNTGMECEVLTNVRSNYLPPVDTITRTRDSGCRELSEHEDYLEWKTFP